MNKYYIEVCPKGRDLRGLDIKEEIEHLGVAGIENVRVSKVYVLEGDFGEQDEEIQLKVANELLIDPVNEEFSFENVSVENAAQINVYYKPGVLDLESNRVQEALDIMGIAGIENVKTIKKYLISGTGLTERLCDFIAEKLLYNKVIEKAEVNLG